MEVNTGYRDLSMTIQHFSAVTLAVSDMARAVEFYDKLGLEMIYGGSDASFTSYYVGAVEYLNLILSPSHTPRWWGRFIIRVDGVDEIHTMLEERGLQPDSPRDAPWGERYFHVTDPDGHEISFAEPLT